MYFEDYEIFILLPPLSCQLSSFCFICVQCEMVVSNFVAQLESYTIIMVISWWSVRAANLVRGDGVGSRVHGREQ